jgi:D-xylonolactonase
MPGNDVVEGPTVVVRERFLLGENPVWHPEDQRLYWTDIIDGRLFRYDPTSATHECVYHGEPVSGFTIQRDGSLLLFMTRGAVRCLRPGLESRLVLEPDAWFGSEPDWAADTGTAYDVRNHFLNDVIADPGGRVYVGVLPVGADDGGVFVVEPDGQVRVAASGITGSNGLGFSSNHRTMFCTDSAPGVRRIYTFDYELRSGKLTNRRIFAELPAADRGLPDGLTVDSAGFVWSARWEGRCLIRYAPDGMEVQRIEVPAGKVTSVTFAGRDYRDLYVTSAAIETAPEEMASGSLFRLRTATPGLPEHRSNILPR